MLITIRLKYFLKIEVFSKKYYGSYQKWKARQIDIE